MVENLVSLPFFEKLHCECMSFSFSLIFLFSLHLFEIENTILLTILNRYYGESLNILKDLNEWEKNFFKRIHHQSSPNSVHCHFSQNQLLAGTEKRKKFCINFWDRNLWEKELTDKWKNLLKIVLTTFLKVTVTFFSNSYLFLFFSLLFSNLIDQRLSK